MAAGKRSWSLTATVSSPKTLDALHLASLEFLHHRGQVQLASYDDRMLACARSLGIPLYPL